MGVDDDVDHWRGGEAGRAPDLGTPYYESVGLLPEPPRINGQRRYSPQMLQRIAIVQFGQQAGFP
jgi:hypothetical protein